MSVFIRMYFLYVSFLYIRVTTCVCVKKFELNNIKKNTKMPQCTQIWSPVFLLDLVNDSLAFVTRKLRGQQRRLLVCGGGPHFYRHDPLERRREIQKGSRVLRAQGGPAHSRNAMRVAYSHSTLYCFSSFFLFFYLFRRPL